jgi:hypothetical protein
MTQVQIAELATARNALEEKRLAYEEAKLVWQPVIAAFRSACDHKNPDGSSAVETGFIYDTCLICSRDV